MQPWDDVQVEWTDAAGRVGGLLQVEGGGPPRQGGFGQGGGTTPEEATYSADVRQEADGRAYVVGVDTAAAWPEDLTAWRLLSEHLHALIEPEVAFPFEVRADRWTEELAVEGVPHPFLVVGSQEQWVAAATVGDRVVQVRGSGPGSLPVRLVRVEPGDVEDPVREYDHDHDPDSGHGYA